jgi:hypothetical protein
MPMVSPAVSCLTPCSSGSTRTVENYKQPHAQRQNASNLFLLIRFSIPFLFPARCTAFVTLTPSKTLC